MDSEDKLNDLAKELAKAKVISFDTETTSTEEMQAEIVGISLAIKAGQAYYIPVGHTSGNNLPIEKVIAALTPSMTNAKIGKVAHNAKYDYIILASLRTYDHPASLSIPCWQNLSLTHPRAISD